MQVPTWIEEEPAHVRDLLVELHRVRRRGMRGLEISTSIPVLVELASTWSPKTSQLSQRKLMTVLLGEVLPKHLDSAQDRVALPLYFGLDEATWTKSEAQRRGKVATEVFHQGLSTFRGPDTGAERPFLLRLASALYELARSAPKLEPFRNYPTPYIDRPKYHNMFEALISQGAKLIAFEGEPGNGKTRLADELVAKRMHQGDIRVFLDASEELRLKVDVALALQEHAGHNYQNFGSLDDDAYIRGFSTYVCSADAPTYIVIDNLQDSYLLDTLIPLTTRSTVIITSRQKLIPSERGESITVRPMEPDEARLLIKALLPTSSRAQREQLAEKLGNKPLAIDHACTGLLADGFMTIQDFCSAFDRLAATVMKRARSPGDQSLPFVYETILDRLRQSPHNYGTKAAALLELVAFVASEAIPDDILRSSLALTSPPDDPALVDVEFQAAQKELQRLHLVTYRAGGFSVHKFTQAILREILRDVEAKRCLDLHRVLADKLANHKPGDAIGESTAELLPHIQSVLLGLSTIESAIQDSEGVARTVSILAQGMRQVGAVFDLAAFARRFFAIPASASGEERRPPRMNERSASLFIEDAYRMGITPRSEHIAMMLHILEHEYSRPHDALDSHGGVKLLETILLAYKYDLCEELLEIYRRQPRKRVKQDAAWRGDVLRLAGDALSSQGRWEKSFTSYRHALKTYNLDPDDLNCLRGRLATLVSIANTSIESGDHQLAKEKVRSAADLMMLHKDRIKDSTVLARMERVSARAMTVELMHHVALGGEVSQGGTYRSDAFKLAHQHHTAAGMLRFLLQVNYDWGCYHLLQGNVETAKQLFEANAMKARELDEVDTALTYHLGLIKLKMLEGGLNLRDISRCSRIGGRFLNFCQRPVRYADAIGVAFVIAVMQDAPRRVVDSLRESALNAHVAVKKRWRFELLDQVGCEEWNPYTVFIP